MIDKVATALMLLSYGAIEIPTKNETNTLRYTKFAPKARTAISIGEESAYNIKYLNESTIVAMLSEESNSLSCLHYALEKILDCKIEEGINMPGRLFSIFIEDYFEQTEHPQASDLVIYTYDENELTMEHFAIVINDKIGESKWGYGPEIREHKLFGVPAHFRNAAWFYTLKKEYRSENGKKKAAANIQECINLQKRILKDLQENPMDLETAYRIYSAQA